MVQVYVAVYCCYGIMLAFDMTKYIAGLQTGSVHLTAKAVLEDNRFYALSQGSSHEQ